ncbi:MAG: RNA-binding S4 domain-containing protein [Marinovum sp.]|nr:RNA-binding S4 domain-containing protein [Marinovum sp.]MBT6534239.1 RNA-binding S4 domain-containing protein [Marinovum sp.]MBT7905883.1 RNA-binding S4 domain-containing protein [Marinovum sp.]
MPPPEQKLRIDKWLWHARFFKTRSLASKIVSAGHVRINGKKISKSATAVCTGDRLRFAQGRIEREVEVLGLGERRGPAAEAQTLYQDHTPVQKIDPQAPRFEGKGRPTKQNRRRIGLMRDQMLE